MFNTKTKPRYTFTWDINKALSYIASLGCNETYDKIQHMEADENSCKFIPVELQKHCRPSHWDILIRFVGSKSNVNLCMVTTLKEYLKQRERTSTINITEKIFVIYCKPNREAKKETHSRRLKEIYNEKCWYYCEHF